MQCLSMGRSENGEHRLGASLNIRAVPSVRSPREHVYGQFKRSPACGRSFL